MTDFAKELKEAKAPVVYISNVMTQPGESDGYTAFDHVKAILEEAFKYYLGYDVVSIEE